ncbi:21231_t:CDS:2, partial [Racocetra persica]
LPPSFHSGILTRTYESFVCSDSTFNNWKVVGKLVKSKEKDNIAIYLNFDMLGSPNYIPFILRGSDAPSDARKGSIRIQQMFSNEFNRLNKPYDVSSMLDGSDFLPFVQNGIPSGGLYTGSSEIKNSESKQKFGGVANVPLDPCNHQACDNLDNVNKDAIFVMSKVALEVIFKFGIKKDLRDYLNGENI